MCPLASFLLMQTLVLSSSALMPAISSLSYSGAFVSLRSGVNPSPCHTARYRARASLPESKPMDSSSLLSSSNSRTKR